jgi:hypothetical protein
MKDVWPFKDDDPHLQALQNKHPVYAWAAIHRCIREKKQFPDWITDYLFQCADRMMFARHADERPRDVRKTLLRIFGFPEKKSGPGSLFDPRPVLPYLKKVLFALHFAERLNQGEDPVTARGNAGNDAFREDVDDRTLQRYLLEVFGLTNLPSTSGEWKPLTDRYFDLVKGTLLNETVTSLF